MKFQYYILIALLIYKICPAQNSDIFQNQLKEIQSLRKLSNDEKFSIEEKIKYGEEAVAKSKLTNIDTVLLKSKRNLSMLFLQSGDFDRFKTISFSNLKHARKIKDTTSVAHSNYYLGFYYHLLEKHDSAYYYYYQSTKHYHTLKDIRNEGEVLYNMATIQEIERDYVGGASNAIKSIALIEQLPETDSNLETLWNANNLIAIVSAELEQYDKSLEYYNKTLAICEKMDDSYENRLFSSINIAALYRRKGDFKTAERLYEKLKKDEFVFDFDPTSYSIILSGLGHSKFKNKSADEEEIKKLYHKAYKISKNEDDQVGLLSISMDISEFYFEINNIDSARFYVNNAYKIGNELVANETILEALLLKSKIETGNAAEKSLNNYIKLSDSLQKAERSNRNKFAIIDYETDQIKAENKQISKERLLFLLLSIGLFITLTFLYIIITQRAKNKELKFVQQQQEANEEIYNLMLSQQDNIEEARVIEKKRISEELHDGILGRLFGTRLSLYSLNMSTSEEAVKSREGYIDELKVIEQEIRKVSHELNTDFVSGSGYMDIIKTLIETQCKAYQLDFKLDGDGAINWDSVSNKDKIHIYRIIQESLQNIYKHAKASVVNISFKLNKNVICISISDNGLGFDTNKAKKGIGIKNINSRVKEIQGEVEIQSEINSGTTIIIRVPI